MLLNLYLFTFVQSKAFILPFCIYEPLAHEAIFFLHNYVQGLPFSSERACTVARADCCLFSPQWTHQCVLSSSLFWFKSKSFIRETKRVGHMRTYDLAKIAEKFQHIIYKNISKSALSLYIVYRESWGPCPPVRQGRGRRWLPPPRVWCCWASSPVACSLLIALRCPSACGRAASPSSLPTEE